MGSTGSDLIRAASNSEAAGQLKYVDGVTSEGLQGVVPVVVSPDGKYLYAGAFHVNTVTVFVRNKETGGLTQAQSIRSDEDLDAVTGFEISPDGKLAVATAFRSGTVVLYKRNTDSGEIQVLDVARKNTEGGKGLGFVIRARFSPDGKRIYALDGEEGGVTVFEVAENNKLKWLQTTTTDRDLLAGSRGVAIVSNGRELVMANYQAKTVVVMEDDPSGKELKIRQVIKDQDYGVEGLAGAFGVAASADGRSVYTCSGRFGGDQAVCAFRVNESGLLELLQEFINDQGDLKSYHGGNSLVVSPDGRNVYATATVSGALACFERDVESGKLRYLETLTDGADQGVLAGASGVTCSPDGRFVYVAAEFKKSISIYQRAPAKTAQ